MNRLDLLVSYIDEGKFVADIGSDHGITAIKVFEEKNPSRVLATDVSKNSLQKLIDKLPYLGYPIETMVTDGIKDLPNEVEQIIISGMGGFLIGKILERGIEIAKNADKLILQPNTDIDYLRHFLHDNGFSILDESIIEDGEFIYHIIVSKYTNSNEKYNSEFEYLYGSKNLKEKSKLTIRLIKSDIDHNKNIIEKIKNIDSKDTKNKLKVLENKVNELESLLCKLEN